MLARQLMTADILLLSTVAVLVAVVYIQCTVSTNDFELQRRDFVPSGHQPRCSLACRDKKVDIDGDDD
jgi:hypothetical protein